FPFSIGLVVVDQFNACQIVAIGAAVALRASADVAKAVRTLVHDGLHLRRRAAGRTARHGNGATPVATWVPSVPRPRLPRGVGGHGRVWRRGGSWAALRRDSLRDLGAGRMGG